jgi:hypothetical protein
MTTPSINLVSCAGPRTNRNRRKILIWVTHTDILRRSFPKRFQTIPKGSEFYGRSCDLASEIAVWRSVTGLDSAAGFLGDWPGYGAVKSQVRAVCAASAT